MSGDRSVMPNPARLRRGWRAGVRGRSQWLDAAAGLAAVGLVLGAIPWSAGTGFGARWRAAVADPHQSSALLGEVAGLAASVAVALAVAFGLARVLSATFAGRIGPVERRGAALGTTRSSRGALVLASVSVLAVLLASAALRGVLAAAARSTGGTSATTWELWTQWPQRTWAVCLVTLAVAGWIELVLSHRRNRLRLAQTPEQARDDLRARGGRR